MKIFILCCGSVLHGWIPSLSNACMGVRYRLGAVRLAMKEPPLICYHYYAAKNQVVTFLLWSILLLRR